MDSTNKPVAWIIDEKMTDCDDNFIWNTGDYPDWQVKDWLPLYTHPVELTDEEIFDVWDEHTNYDGEWLPDSSIENFAKAILRKAQEK